MCNEIACSLVNLDSPHAHQRARFSLVILLRSGAGSEVNRLKPMLLLVDAKSAEQGGTMEPGFAIPILPARDLEETRLFYEQLGFNTTGWWPSEFGGYAILVRGDLVMHFFLFKEISPYASYGQCYWRVQDVDALHAEYQLCGLPGSGIPRLASLENKPWGMREFAVVDPSGNLIRVGQATER
jgi:catechol 2,3-dioxygenase-like lactoylglutathione lyase family enzyme